MAQGLFEVAGKTLGRASVMVSPDQFWRINFEEGSCNTSYDWRSLFLIGC